MSNFSHSVKFSDQPYSQNERFQVHVPEIEEAQQKPTSNGRSIQMQAPPPSHNYNNDAHQYQPDEYDNQRYQPHQSQTYSPHYAHHQRMQQQKDIEKQFNYSGSRLRSPHHDPASKIQARLRQGIHLDYQYNQPGVQGNYDHDPQGEHCPVHCPNHTGQYYHSHLNNSLKNQSKLMLYPQPHGSGAYTNQLEQRNIHTKTACDFHKTNGKRQTQSSHNSLRGSPNNSTTFNSIMQNKRAQEKLREKLYFDERTKTVPKTTIKNGIIEDIVSEGDVFTGNKQLMNSIFKLKSLHLLKQNGSHVNRYSGVGKLPFVFNNYHQKSTNNGYSRQEKGGFFFTR